jgi:peptide deformylase
MTVRKILTEPNKLLRKVSSVVEKVGNEERTLMDDMLETMYKAPGIGLAAIQIGVPKRIIVMDISRDESKKEPLYLINPIIKNKNLEKKIYEEGCLSVPDQFAEIERPKTCMVEYLDYEGKKQQLKAEGLLATCIQHEMDHLEGILFIDYLSKLKKSMIIKKLSIRDVKKNCFYGHAIFCCTDIKIIISKWVFSFSCIHTTPSKITKRAEDKQISNPRDF